MLLLAIFEFFTSFLGGSTDSSNRDQLQHRNIQQHPARRHSEAKRISAPNLDNYPSKFLRFFWPFFAFFALFEKSFLKKRSESRQLSK